MRLYLARDTADDDSARHFRASLREARKAGKEKHAPDAWTDIEVAEVVVDSTKQGLLLAIEGKPRIQRVIRTWRLTRKGTLVAPEERRVL